MTAVPPIKLAPADHTTRIGQAFMLAREGLGYEDIIVRLNLPRTSEWKAWVRTMVLRRIKP